jgi:hypothetical protein
MLLLLVYVLILLALGIETMGLAQAWSGTW